LNLNTEVAIGVVITLALLAANLPFMNQRLFAVLALKNPKPFWLRLLELLALYLLVGLVARVLEAKVDSVYAQGWQFYAVTLCLFLVAAYPGFVWRYLWRRA
jgi:hypothetical protein